MEPKGKNALKCFLALLFLVKPFIKCVITTTLFIFFVNHRGGAWLFDKKKMGQTFHLKIYPIW